MSKTSYTERITVDEISSRMSLRIPQYQSLQILSDIMAMDFKSPSLEKDINAKYRTFKDFERSFPSLTFALATGVGKTRLMGAFMLYLNQNYGVKNFFVVAPNLTIYEKLKQDFGAPNHPKYAFKGIQQFVANPPNIVTGENYKDRTPGQANLFDCININIFNIGKINIEVRKGFEPQIKRLNEVIGDSYFNYLKGLTDLVMLMDESHHYRADRGFQTLNDLEPLLGLELTATPQVETSKGPIKFKNVVYEYSLAKAIGNYVKTPWVATKKGFNPAMADEWALDKIKLYDGVMLHRNAIAELRAYAENERVPAVKPFVLVVCRDTVHAKEVLNHIKSQDFFNGYYENKVIEIHSAQKGMEKEENIRLLLDLENPTNRIEIVIHVNMLKEGWDVTNLYTIIPLRVATSLTLREQTIGRGLRLPYGRITGNDAVDRLTIVAHDKFDDIVRAASDENSIIRKEHIIEIDDLDMQEKETVRGGTAFEEQIKALEQQKTFARSEEKIQAIEAQIKSKKYVGQALEELTTQVVNIRIPSSSEKTVGEKTLNIIPSMQDFVKPELQEILVKRAIEIAEREERAKTGEQLSFLTHDEMGQIKANIQIVLEPTIKAKIRSTINIPNIAVVSAGGGERIIDDFDLCTKYIHKFETPTTEIIMENLKTGKIVSASIESGQLQIDDTPANYILGEVLNQDSFLSYEKYSDLLFKLVKQMLDFIGIGKDAQQTIKTLAVHKKEIAKEIVKQISEHARITVPKVEVKILQKTMTIQTESYTKLKSDGIKKYSDNVPGYMIKKVVFGGFTKCCTDLAKFDSVPEQHFAVVLERSTEVEKWLRPAIGQLPISLPGGSFYQPDFIVETADSIHIIEIKDHREVRNPEVIVKAQLAQQYCDNINKVPGIADKKWSYSLIAHFHVQRTSGFSQLLNQAEKLFD